jgi:hypothetical protein
MRGAIPSLPHYAFMAWYPVKNSTGIIYLSLYLYRNKDEANSTLEYIVLRKTFYRNFGFTPWIECG